MTPRFVKHNFNIINVKHIKNIETNNLEFNIEHGSNKKTIISAGDKSLWEYAHKCLCQFLSELDNEKTAFTSMFNFNEIFERASMIDFFEEKQEE
jgi:hypothetical protein